MFEEEKIDQVLKIWRIKTPGYCDDYLDRLTPPGPWIPPISCPSCKTTRLPTPPAFWSSEEQAAVMSAFKDVIIPKTKSVGNFRLSLQEFTERLEKAREICPSVSVAPYQDYESPYTSPQSKFRGDVIVGAWNAYSFVVRENSDIYRALMGVRSYVQRPVYIGVRKRELSDWVELQPCALPQSNMKHGRCPTCWSVFEVAWPEDCHDQDQPNLYISKIRPGLYCNEPMRAILEPLFIKQNEKVRPTFEEPDFRPLGPKKDVPVDPIEIDKELEAWLSENGE